MNVLHCARNRLTLHISVENRNFVCVILGICMGVRRTLLNDPRILAISHNSNICFKVQI